MNGSDTGYRRVVIGEDKAGKSVVVSDQFAEQRSMRPIRDLGVADIWGADVRCAVPSSGDMPAYERFFPAPNGFRVMVMRIGPEQDHVGGAFDMERYQEQRHQVLPGYHEDAVIDDPGSPLHKTKTVDVGVVLEGEITLTLDDGVVVRLGVGDFVVQNGTRHSWHNTGSETCVMAMFVLGADSAESAGG
jgi:mannose-6-phosphate isomerase-like protein (cupin superfamily)